MLKRVAIDGIELPRLYIAENNSDVKLAKANGIPFIRWRYGQEALIKQLLRPAIEKMFPGINWNKVLGERTPVKNKVVIVNGNDCYDHVQSGSVEYDAEEMLGKQLEHDDIVDDIERAKFDEVQERTVGIANGSRAFGGCGGTGYDIVNETQLSIEDYVGDLSSSVDIDALQKLGMLPTFVGDVADCIRKNLSQSMRWTEGYTKKLGVVIGNCTRQYELPNLLIIDVSSSIPDGIAATMLTLADTLRSQLNADLIITSARSGYYPAGSELPKPQTLIDYYGRNNEREEFAAILEKYIAGREFGHVISFGDWDNPGCMLVDGYNSNKINMAGTKVHCLHHYHTNLDSWRYDVRNEEDQWTGYARWVEECCPDVEKTFDTEWCNIINDDYTLEP